MQAQSTSRNRRNRELGFDRLEEHIAAAIITPFPTVVTIPIGTGSINFFSTNDPGLIDAPGGGKYPSFETPWGLREPINPAPANPGPLTGPLGNHAASV